ncbi:hypothetical protein D3C73_1585420 [compost metagenome]
MANTVPTIPLTITKNFFDILVMLANPSPEAYSALSLVVQIFRPRTIIAGMISPCRNITSEISARL